MALTVSLTKLNTFSKAKPVAAVAPARDNNGRFISAAKLSATKLATPNTTKATARARAPYRITNKRVYPYNGGTMLGYIYSPKLKAALVKSGLVV